MEPGAPGPPWITAMLKGALPYILGLCIAMVVLCSDMIPQGLRPLRRWSYVGTFLKVGRVSLRASQ